MSSHFALRLRKEVHELTVARSSNRLKADAHLHFCDVDKRVKWDEVLLADVLRVINDETRASGLVPTILFQSAREKLRGKLPDTAKDLMRLLAQCSEDPAALYLFSSNDIPYKSASVAKELTSALATIDPEWMALVERVDASLWDPVQPEHVNVLLTTTSTQQ